jgi:hypothetical protein
MLAGNAHSHATATRTLTRNAKDFLHIDPPV